MIRWDLYAPHIRYLEVGPLSMTPMQYRIILFVAAERPLLPNLLGLFMRPENWETDYRQGHSQFRFSEMRPFPANWTFAMHFTMLVMGPSLRVLEICYTGATLPDFQLILKNRAPLLSDLSLIGATPDYQHRPCNFYLRPRDSLGKEQQKKLGYSAPQATYIDGGNGGYAKVYTVFIPASADHLPRFTSILKLTLDGAILGNTDIFAIGTLPNLHTLVLMAISAKVYHSSRWEEYSSSTREDLFPRLRDLSLVQTEPSGASLVFSMSFMLRRIQHVFWESSKPAIPQTTQSLYIEALGALSRGASSLSSLDLSYPECIDTPDQRSQILQVVSQLWSLDPVLRISTTGIGHVNYKRYWISSMMYD
ncbi:hypothetical protein FRC11_010204 [Ceratobasidium sp. 423]|nr:hypothetical protein FRC11_010204 [Ceratobasidium sp. 423]